MIVVLEYVVVEVVGVVGGVEEVVLGVLDEVGLDVVFVVDGGIVGVYFY